MDDKGGVLVRIFELRLVNVLGLSVLGSFEFELVYLCGVFVLFGGQECYGVFG